MSESGCCASVTSRDPLNASTRSAYGYGGNNPLNGSDPSGMFGIPDWVPVVGGVCVVGSDGCGATQSFAQDHPKVSQGVADLAGGTLNGITLGNAKNALDITDTGLRRVGVDVKDSKEKVNWAAGLAYGGQAIGLALLVPFAVANPAVFGNVARSAMLARTWSDCINSSAPGVVNCASKGVWNAGLAAFGMSFDKPLGSAFFGLLSRIPSTFVGQLVDEACKWPPLP